MLTRLNKYNINKHILKFFKSINSFGISKTKILRKFYPKKNHKKRKAKEIVLNMHKKNMNIENIAEIVNLSREEVEKIIKESK